MVAINNTTRCTLHNNYGEAHHNLSKVQCSTECTRHTIHRPWDSRKLDKSLHQCLVSISPRRLRIHHNKCSLLRCSNTSPAQAHYQVHRCTEVPKAWVKPDFRAWLNDRCIQWAGTIKLLVTLCPKLRSLACRAGRQPGNNSSKEAGLATSFPTCRRLREGRRSKSGLWKKIWHTISGPHLFLSLISCGNSQYIAFDREG